jgi:hypothetical protein
MSQTSFRRSSNILRIYTPLKFYMAECTTYRGLEVKPLIQISPQDLRRLGTVLLSSHLTPTRTSVWMGAGSPNYSLLFNTIVIFALPNFINLSAKTLSLNLGLFLIFIFYLFFFFCYRKEIGKY